MPKTSTTYTTSIDEIINEIIHGGTVLQQIIGLVVTPYPNSVSFAFQTVLDSSPLIEIYNHTGADPRKDLIKTNLVGSNRLQQQNIKPRGRNHNFRLPHPADFVPASFPGFGSSDAPLEQDTHFWFKLTADSGSFQIASAVTIGHFYTSKRNVSVRIEELLVNRFGSSDIGNEVDNAVNGVVGGFATVFNQEPPQVNRDYKLSISVFLFDQVRALVDSRTDSFTSADNNADIRDPFPLQTLQCPAAHDFVWMSGFGHGNGGNWAWPVFWGSDEPVVPPNPPRHDDGDSGPWAEAVAMSPRLPDTFLEMRNPMPLVLDSGNFGTSYKMTAWMFVSLVAPRFPPEIWGQSVHKFSEMLAELVAKNLKAHRTQRLTPDSDGVLAVVTPKKINVLVPGAENTLWAQARDLAERSAKTKTPWKRLGKGFQAPIAVLLEKDGSMDIVARGNDGNAWHTSWDRTTEGVDATKWQNLGQPIHDEIALVRKGKALNIFILNDEGMVVQAALSGDAKRPVWKSLGGRIKTELKATPLQNGKVYLFGLGADGDVLCAMYSAHSKPNWTSLGGASKGSASNVRLTVLSDGKLGVVLLAVKRDRSVHRKTWNGKTWSPAGEGWKELGPLDLLIASASSTPRPRAAVAPPSRLPSP